MILALYDAIIRGRLDEHARARLGKEELVFRVNLQFNIQLDKTN